MPRKNFYISEADEEEFYLKAKKMAGDSLSSVIVQSLKDFVIKQEAFEKGLEEVKVWKDATGDHADGTISGQQFKFMGKLLSKDEDTGESGSHITISLYLTRKGKYILYVVLESKEKGETYYDFSQIESKKELIGEVKKGSLTQKMLTEAEEKMPDIICEELDI